MRRAVDQCQRARAEGRIQTAQVGDGVADEERAAIDIVVALRTVAEAGADVAELAGAGGLDVAHETRLLGRDVLRHQLQQCIGHVDDAQLPHLLGGDAFDGVGRGGAGAWMRLPVTTTSASSSSSCCRLQPPSAAAGQAETARPCSASNQRANETLPPNRAGHLDSP